MARHKTPFAVVVTLLARSVRCVSWSTRVTDSREIGEKNALSDYLLCADRTGPALSESQSQSDRRPDRLRSPD